MALNAESHHTTFSRTQLQQYVCKIYKREPEHGASLLAELEERIQRDPLGALTSLQQHHLATFPFGNLVLHYSQHHTIALDPDLLFHKMVERGFGGYCVENTGMFAIVLRSLGFKMYTGAAKVNKDLGKEEDTGRFHGWSHMVIFVTIGKEKYMVDVGFGPYGATRPLLLEEGRTFPAIRPGEMRLTQDDKLTAESGQKLWLLQFRANAEERWKTAYAFSEIEFRREDYEIMNFWTSQHRTSMFVRGFIISIFLLDENGEDIVGSLVAVKDVVKRNIKGQTQVLQTMKTEEERVDALAKCFNIHLQPMEVRGIQSMGTELGSS